LLGRLAQNEELGCTGCEARSGRGLGPVTHLILKRAWASRPSGQWNDEDCDVLADGAALLGHEDERITSRVYGHDGRGLHRLQAIVDKISYRGWAPDQRN
jgi:hypothetical protein